MQEETGKEPSPGVAPEVHNVSLMRKAKRLIKIVFAFTIIAIAALLGLVPGVPGWPLGIIGLTILAAEYVWARRLLNRIKRGATRLRDALLPRRKRPKA